MIAFLKHLFARPTTADDRVVIDQKSYYDGLEENCRRIRALELAVEKDRGGMAIAVGSWARDTVSKRARAVIPRTVRRDVAAWLPGLAAEEIMNLARAAAFDVRHHIFGDDRIAGVRKVQPLPEAMLIWPKPRLIVDPKDERGSGGGPRRQGGLK